MVVARMGVRIREGKVRTRVVVQFGGGMHACMCDRVRVRGGGGVDTATAADKLEHMLVPATVLRVIVTELQLRRESGGGGGYWSGGPQGLVRADAISGA